MKKKCKHHWHFFHTITGSVETHDHLCGGYLSQGAEPQLTIDVCCCKCAKENKNIEESGSKRRSVYYYKDNLRSKN